MGHMCDALTGADSGSKFGIAEKEVLGDPKPERDPRAGSKKDAHGEDLDLIVRKKKYIGAEDSADCSGCADKWNMRILIDIDMCKRGAHSGKQIEKEKLYFS